MASRSIADLHPTVRDQFLFMESICLFAGINIFITESLRPPEEQDAAYAKGRTVPGAIVTHARAWQSYHQPWIDGKALAFDIAFRPEGAPRGVTWHGPWDLVGALGEYCGLEWGGRWPRSKRDRPHFQNTLGMDIAELRRTTGHE